MLTASEVNVCIDYVTFRYFLKIEITRSTHKVVNNIHGCLGSYCIEAVRVILYRSIIVTGDDKNNI